MQVDKKEILHIANLACLNIEEEKIQEYINNLQDILNFANVVNGIDTDNINETIGSTSNINVFREDEVKQFSDTKSLLENASEIEQNMFKIPKIL